MYVLVDRGQMAITHKHSNREVLNAMSWIECTNYAITIPLGNPAHWQREFTPAELKKIYLHATGTELQGYGNVLGGIVHDVAKRLPESVVNAIEVFEQAKCVMDGDKSHYQYLPGSKVPKEHDGIYEPPPLKTAPDPGELQRAASTAQQYGNPAASSAGAASSGVQTPRAPSAPRTGGTREIIYSVADQMWEAAGKPTALPRILELRKNMMTVLETEHSIKKTTSSTALGDWQKLRLS